MCCFYFQFFVCRHFLYSTEHLFLFSRNLFTDLDSRARTDWGADTCDKNNTKPGTGCGCLMPRLRPSVCRQARNFLYTSGPMVVHNINTRGQIQQRDCRESGHWTDFLSTVVIEAFYDLAVLIATQIGGVGFILSRKYSTSLRSSN